MRPLLRIIAAEQRFDSWQTLKAAYDRQHAGTRNPIEQLCDAAQDGDLAGMQAALTAGASIWCSEMDYGNKPPLFFAVEGGDPSCVALLLAQGSPTAIWHFDALELAQQQSSHSAVIEQLQQRRDDEERLLQLIMSGDESAALKLLSQCPALANAFHNSPYRAGPLMMAAKVGMIAICQLLITAGARLDSHINNSRRTALTYAIVHGQTKTARLLKKAGAQSDPIAEYHYAVAIGDIDLVTRYLDAGMDVNAKNSCCQHALPQAVARLPQDRTMFDFLIGRGAEINQSRGWEDYCWYFALIRDGNTTVMQMLIEAGLDLDLTDSRGVSARHVMGECGWKLEI